MTKRIVALLMVLAMLCSSIGAFAEHEHVWEDIGWVDDVKPTCTTGATKIQHCTAEGCDPATGKTQTVEVEKLGHNFVEVSRTEPTYISEGTVYYECSRCDETKEETLDKLVSKYGPTEKYTVLVDLADQGLESAHDPHTVAFEDVKGAKAATCTEAGARFFLCAECGKEFKVEIKALGHKDPTDPEKVKTRVLPGDEPTCTKKGVLTHYYCGVCNQEVTWTTEIEMVPHTYGEAVTIPADCVNDEKVVKTCAVCGHEDVVVHKGTALKHTWEREGYDYVEKDDHVFKTATCTEDGSKGKALVCDDCGAVKDMGTAQVVPKLDHQKWLDENVDKFYTVDEDGKIVVDRQITAGESEIDPVPVGNCLTHKTEEECEAEPEECVYQGLYGALKVNYVPATCVDAGSLTVECVDCSATLSIEIPATGHHYVIEMLDQEGKAVKDCTKANSVLYKCDNQGCEDRYNQAIEPAKEHTLDERNGQITNKVLYYTQQKAADSKAEEYAYTELAHCIPYDVHYKCAIPFCEEEIVVTVNPTEEDKHDAGGVYIIYEEATCTKDGRKLYNCAKCGYSQDEKYSALGHDFQPSDNDAVKTPATCTEPGVRVMKCSRCDATKEGPIPALGHHYVKTMTIIADCTKGIVGKEIYTCSICKDSYEKITGDGHEYGTFVAHDDPTCTKDGVDQFWCANCHNLVTRILPATGHSFEYTNNTKTDNPEDRIGEEAFKAAHDEACAGGGSCVPATCKNSNPHGTLHSVMCTDCTAKLEWEEDDKPEGHTMFKVDEKGDSVLNRFVLNTNKMPTCETAGEAYYVCTLCEETQILELAPISHNWEITFDTETGTYNMVCQKLKTQAAGTRDRLIQLMKNAGYDPMVAEAVADQLCATKSEYIKGVGCGEVEKIAVHTPLFEITKISESRGQIKLVENTWPTKDEPFVRITWRYTLGNGDTISFVTTREVRWDWDAMEDDEYIGTFKLSGLSVPEDAHCDFINVEVVTDPDADELYRGQYVTYGTKTL